MRKFLVFLFLISFCLKSQNTLRIVSQQGETFKLYLDDSLYNTMPQAELLVEGLKKDTLGLKIEFEKTKLSRKIYLLEKGRKVDSTEFVYLVNILNGEPKLLFYSYEPYVAATKKIVPEKPLIDTTKKYDNNVFERYAEVKNRKIDFFNNFPKDGRCQVAMPASYINYMRQFLKRAETDNEKLYIIEYTCRNNCISVKQLSYLLSFIPYEIEKLSLIRVAYFSLIDTANCRSLDTCMKLQSSKKELADFFRNWKQYKYITGTACDKASPENQINALAESLKAYSSDVEKLELFRKKYSSYCFNNEQIRNILAGFTHDREKLEVAKLIYFHSTEKSSFENILDVFSYTSSVSEMKSFISKQK